MIDLKFYFNSLLPIEKSKLMLRHFGFKKFKGLSGAQWFFKEKAMDEVQNVSGKYQQDLKDIVTLFAQKLDDEQLSFADKAELVLESCDINQSLFSFLDVKGSRSVTCVCPKCKGFANGKGKAERAWIPNGGKAKAVKCNHRSSCGFYGDLISVYAEEYSITKGEAMNALAAELNVDLTPDEVHVGQKQQSKPKKELVPKVYVPQEVQYTEFDTTKKFIDVKIEKYLTKYADMSEEQQFKMIATAIYEYSLTTKQWGKEKYYRAIGVRNKILKEKLEMTTTLLGYLHKQDIEKMVKYLSALFPKEDLVKYGVIHEKDSKHSHQFKIGVEEGLIVVPNFDLYTNMCTGLKYRKTKLKSWIDRKTKDLVVDNVKEPEFSYGRIANPLPYHLTREALLNPDVSFRFFEGQKDLHSIPFVFDICDIAIPGTNGINEEMLGLFKGRKVTLYFDQDEEGQKGAEKLKVLLEKAGAIVSIKKWDIELGGDVNDVLQNGFIQKIV